MGLHIDPFGELEKKKEPIIEGLEDKKVEEKIELDEFVDTKTNIADVDILSIDKLMNFKTGE